MKSGQKGKTKRLPSFPAGKIFSQVISSVQESANKRKRLTRMQIIIQHYAMRAAKGDMSAAELLLKLHTHLERYGDFVHKPLKLTRAEMLKRGW